MLLIINNNYIECYKTKYDFYFKTTSKVDYVNVYIYFFFVFLLTLFLKINTEKTKGKEKKNKKLFIYTNIRTTIK